MVFTLTHNEKPDQSLLEDPVWVYWKHWVEKDMLAYKKWHDYWVERAENGD
jgi:hypothetical protein